MSLKTKLGLFLGAKLLILGCALILGRNYLHEYCNYLVIHLAPDSMMLRNWERNPYPLQMEFFVFNWTNPEHIFDTDIKPNFQERGPYVFDETKEKVNIVWNDNKTISFNLKRTWHFAEGQNTSLADNVTTLNVMTVVAATQSRYWSYFSYKPLSFIMSSSGMKLGFEKSVREVLFEGYQDTLVTLGNTFGTGNALLKDKFSFFYGRNNSAKYEGYYNMDIDFENRGMIREWDYAKTSRGLNEKCNRIESSFPDMFRGNLQKDEPFEFFFSDICRPMRFDFAGEVTVKGIRGYKYTIGDTMLDNGTKIPGNDCYCNGECMPSGVMNISSCIFDTPVLLSLPNFYKADPYYSANMDGMRPDPKEHEFYLILEPITGIVLDFTAALQINVLLQPFPHILLFNNAPKKVMPILWFRQRFTLPDEIVSGLSTLLELPRIFMLIGMVLTVVGIITLFLLVRYHRRRTNKIQISKEKNAAELKTITKINNN